MSMPNEQNRKLFPLKEPWGPSPLLKGMLPRGTIKDTRDMDPRIKATLTLRLTDGGFKLVQDGGGLKVYQRSLFRVRVWSHSLHFLWAPDGWDEPWIEANVPLADKHMESDKVKETKALVEALCDPEMFPACVGIEWAKKFVDQWLKEER